MGDSRACKIMGVGTVRFRLADGTVRQLTEVRHVPALSKGLISLGVLEVQGFRFVGVDGHCSVYNGDRLMLMGVRHGNLYFLRGDTVEGGAMVSEVLDEKSMTQTQLWHMRLGHVGEKGLKALSKRGLLGDEQLGKLDFCEHCILGKQTRVKFDTAEHTTAGIIDYIHTDV